MGKHSQCKVGSPHRGVDIRSHPRQITDHALRTVTSSQNIRIQEQLALFVPVGVPVTEGRISKEPSRYEMIPRFKELQAARADTIQRLNTLIHTHFGGDYHVQPFGSTCYGAGRPESDLDLCIFDYRRPHGIPPRSAPSELPPIYDVKTFANLLIEAKYKAVSYIKATVPIVKFTDPDTGLSCDVNVNHRLGCYNTRLFKQYCRLYPPLAPTLRKIKSWARHVRLNSPSTPGVPVSFSSYALTLMVIAGLQRTGHLPNLQAKGCKDVSTTFWDVSKDGEHRQVIIRFGQGKDWSPPRDFDIADLLRRWFRYWGFDHTYRTTSTVVSIRDGGFVSWSDATDLPTGSALHGPRVKFDDPKAYKLVVLDPFLPKNCTGRISSEILKRFQRECRQQYARLAGLSYEELMASWRRDGVLADFLSEVPVPPVRRITHSPTPLTNPQPRV
ncbi:hypothetical protein C8T65DRAFT_117080 [Cerioporus squamosus]|nr:hypothetical protein C8T65DRAFT_117080 [Cerioporus squamosus]